MKKLLLISTLVLALASCGSSADYTQAKEYATTLIDKDLGIYNATVTDVGMLVIAVDAVPGANFDIFAKTYLQDAINAGTNIKGCLIVDVKDCQFMDGAVTGKRIGKAYKR